MSDQSLTGVTTRSLDTSQDIQRAEAISTRSGLARLYADQFRATRSNLRRGAVVRETSGPAVPAASGDVTQTQDVSVPGSFQDVIDAAGDFQGDSQSANQTVNPGAGGGYGRGSSVRGGSGSGAQGSSSSSSGQGDPSCPSGWRDSNGNCTDPPSDVGCITLPDGRKIGDCSQEAGNEGECRSVYNPETGAIEQQGDCAPAELPDNAAGSNARYYYTSAPYGDNGGRTYTAFDRETGKLLHSIAVDRNNKRICRALMDCYTGGGSQVGFYNNQFGLGIRIQ